MNSVAKLRKEVTKLRSKWRKVVTGDAEKRIRDHLREKQEEPKYVKLLDKIGFTIGVVNVLICQYFLLNVPEYFPIWYGVVIPLLLLSRFYYFRAMNWQYFMIDFCYFTVFGTLVNNFLFYHSGWLFKICFIHACGTLPMAIPIWRNSFIFHDYDKIVSVYIHLLPTMLYYTLRWSNRFNEYCSDDVHCQSLHYTDFLAAYAYYLFWQGLYLLKTEILDKAKFDANPQLVTSLRWLAKDTSNATARVVLKLARNIHLFGPQEDFNATSMKTKLLFVVTQLLFTICWTLPTYWLYSSQTIHLLSIVIVFVIAVFNGASFYIEVFSIRYQLHLAKLSKMQAFAVEANKLMQKVADLEGVVSTPRSSHSSAKKNNRFATATTPSSVSQQQQQRGLSTFSDEETKEDTTAASSTKVLKPILEDDKDANDHNNQLPTAAVAVAEKEELEVHQKEDQSEEESSPVLHEDEGRVDMQDCSRSRAMTLDNMVDFFLNITTTTDDDEVEERDQVSKTKESRTHAAYQAIEATSREIDLILQEYEQGLSIAIDEAHQQKREQQSEQCKED